MPNNMSVQDKAYHRVPLELWHKIFSYVYDHPELHVASWDKHKGQPVLKETPGKWSPADPITFDTLANHDTLWPGSAHNFWQWLIPRTTWRIDLPADPHGHSLFEESPRHLIQASQRCVGYLERLEKVHDTPVKSIDGVFDATYFDQADAGIALQGYRCDSGDYFHKMRPATWFMSHAMKTFQGRLRRFRIVLEVCKVDAMETSKYCHWVAPNAAVPLFWQGSLGSDCTSRINEFPMVYFSMADVMAEMQESGTEFKVILRGIDDKRRSDVEHERYPGNGSHYVLNEQWANYPGPWTSDQELYDRDITDLWEGEAVEEARSLAAIEDKIERYDRESAYISHLAPRFDCYDIGHILFMKALGQHRAARGEAYDYRVRYPEDTDSEDTDSDGGDADADAGGDDAETSGGDADNAEPDMDKT
jgi:hypothetical protein